MFFFFFFLLSLGSGAGGRDHVRGNNKFINISANRSFVLMLVDCVPRDYVTAADAVVTPRVKLLLSIATKRQNMNLNLGVGLAVVNANP